MSGPVEVRPLVAEAERVREAWGRYAEAGDDAAPALYEAYVAAAVELTGRVAPLVEAMAEANLFAVSCEDGTGRFLRLAVEEAAEEGGQLLLFSGAALGRSDELPSIDDLSGARVDLALLLGPGTGEALERLEALEAELRRAGDADRADEAGAIRRLLAGQVEGEK